MHVIRPLHLRRDSRRIKEVTTKADLEQADQTQLVSFIKKIEDCQYDGDKM